MKVAIDTGPLSSGHKVRGIGAHTEKLTKKLKQIKSTNIQVRPFDFSTNPKLLSAKTYDLLHFTSFHPFFLTILKENVDDKPLMVVTIHDLIPLIYPNAYPPGYQGKLNFIRQKKRLKNVDAVITISETSKKDIVRLLNYPEQKVHVVYLGCDEKYGVAKNKELLSKTKTKYNLPGKFALHVGDINYNKNIGILIKGCKKAKIPLVIVGSQAYELEKLSGDLLAIDGPRDYIRFLFNIPHPEQRHYDELVPQFKKNKNIIRTGYVSDEELNDIYNLATVCIMPSLYEGFGLNSLKAFATETPIIASKIDAHKEIISDAAVYFNPKSVNDLAKAIKKVLSSQTLRSTLIEKGSQRLKDFSWRKAAKETIDVYKKVINEKS